MSKKKVISFIDFGIFPGSVCLSNGYKVLDLIKEIKKRNKKDKSYKPFLLAIENIDKTDGSRWSAYHQVIRIKKYDYFVYFIIITDPFLFLDGSYTNLAHEVLHIIQWLLPRLLNRQKEAEAEAYLHSHIMDQCLLALRGKSK